MHREHIYWIVSLGTDATVLVDTASDLADVDALCDVVAAAVECSRASERALGLPMSRRAPPRAVPGVSVASVVEFLVAEFGRAGLPPLFSRADAVGCLEAGDQRAWERLVAFLYGCVHGVQHTSGRSAQRGEGGGGNNSSDASAGTSEQLALVASGADPDPELLALAEGGPVMGLELVPSPSSALRAARQQQQLEEEARLQHQRQRKAQRKAAARAKEERAELEREDAEAERVAAAEAREERAQRARARARARIRARAASATAPWVPQRGWNASTLVVGADGDAAAGAGGEAWEVDVAARGAVTDGAAVPAASRRPLSTARTAPLEGLYVGNGMWDPTFHRDRRRLSKLGLAARGAGDGGVAHAAARRGREAWREPAEQALGRAAQREQRRAQGEEKSTRQQQRAEREAAPRAAAEARARAKRGGGARRAATPARPRPAAIMDADQSETRKRLAFSVVKSSRRTANSHLSDRQSAIVHWIDEQGVPLTSSLPTHAVGGSARRRIATATTVANALRDGVLLCELASAVCGVADATPVPKPQDDAASMANLNWAFERLRSLPHMDSRHIWAQAAVRGGKIDVVWALLNDVRLAWARGLQAEQAHAKAKAAPRRAATARKAQPRTPSRGKARRRTAATALQKQRREETNDAATRAELEAAKVTAAEQRRHEQKAREVELSLGLPNVADSQRAATREWLEGMGLRVLESVPRRHPTTRVGTSASAAPRIDR